MLVWSWRRVKITVFCDATPCSLADMCQRLEQLVPSFFRTVSVPFLPVFPLRLFYYCIYILSFDPIVSLFPGTYFNIILPSNSGPRRLLCFFQNFWQLFIPYVIHGTAHPFLFVLLTSATFVEQYHSWSCSEGLIRSILLTWYSF